MRYRGKGNHLYDADARIQNLTRLRDRLRNMLRDKRADIKDIIETELELANTKSQLDSLHSMREVFICWKLMMSKMVQI